MLGAPGTGVNDHHREGEMQTLPPFIMGNKGALHELFQKLRLTLGELLGDLSLWELELVHVIIKKLPEILCSHILHIILVLFHNSPKSPL